MAETQKVNQKQINKATNTVLNDDSDIPKVDEGIAKANELKKIIKILYTDIADTTNLSVSLSVIQNVYTSILRKHLNDKKLDEAKLEKEIALNILKMKIMKNGMK